MNKIPGVTAFLPCRKGSQRVPNKNTRPIGSFEKGLLQIKLNQLLNTPSISRIIVSTDDEDIIKYVCDLEEDRLEWSRRPSYLASSHTDLRDLIYHASELIHSGTILWTHVTSPFVNEDTYEKAINAFFEGVFTSKFDSLCSVTEFRSFAVFKGDGVNFDLNSGEWPATQDLDPIMLINSAIFIADREFYVDKRRVGKKVLMHRMSELESIDVDWPSDFELVTKLLTVY